MQSITWVVVHTFVKAVGSAFLRLFCEVIKRMTPRITVASMVATSYMRLFKFKLIKIKYGQKSSVPQSHWPRCKCSVATCRGSLPYGRMLLWTFLSSLESAFGQSRSRGHFSCTQILAKLIIDSVNFLPFSFLIFWMVLKIQ